MKCLLALLLCLAATTGLSQEARLWFVFLTKGDAPRPDKAELEKMQAEHLANFGRLFKDGKLLMAGPLKDPAGFKRGILALWVKDRAEIMECFQPDRYVTSGIMDVDAHAWELPKSAINLELPDPDAIEENRFALISSDRRVPAYLLEQHRQYIESTVKPSLSGKFAEPGHYEVLMFQGKDDAALDLLKRDPLVRLGFARLEFMPLWMAKEALKPVAR